MANKKASKKAERKNIAQKAINKSKNSRIKTERKKFDQFLTTDATKATEQFSKTQSLLAKAAKTSLIHWKKAARLISRMAQKLKKTS